MNNYSTVDKEGVKIIEIPLFARTGLVVHGFTTRLGGVSGAPWDGLNLGYHVGDKKEDVSANRGLLCRACGIEPGGLVAGEQVHGDVVAVVGPGDAGKGALGPESALPAADGLLTRYKDLMLIAFYADCVPVLLLDPTTPAVGVVHAGWKGTVEGIAAKAVGMMQTFFDTDPARCLAAIGPSIGPCCFQVDGKVTKAFRDRFGWFDKIFKGHNDTNRVGEKGFLNLWEANRRQLLDAGLREENIAVAGLCTCCHRDLFFSHRGSGGLTGRIGAFIMLQEKEAEGPVEQKNISC